MKSKIFIWMLLASLAAVSCGGKGSSGNEAGNDTENTDTTEIKTSAQMDTTLAFNPADLPEEPIFEIHTTEGTITVLLYKDTPLHRDNFVKLASRRFYDDILFHRVIYGFMIQTGDPLTKDPANKNAYGSGGPGYTIPAEFVAAHTHKKGAIAAARIGDVANPRKESSGSQFYIVQDPRTCAQLDGEYTVFGETIDGLDVIDRIASMPTDAKDRPVKDVRIISITPVI